jgi:hypothetical protein
VLRFIFSLLLCCCFLQSCVSPKMSQELEGGKLHFMSGDFKAAFKALLPLAVCGKAEAEYAVGYMYYNGYGVAREPISGLFWMRRSAAHGYPPAIKALHLIDHPPCVPPCQKNCASPKRAASGPLYKDQTEGQVLKKSAALPVTLKRTYTTLLKQSSNKDYYTLQLMGAYELATVRKAQRDLPLKTRVGRTFFKEKTWYILTHGQYASFAEAKSALSALPSSIKAGGAWVRKERLVN